jgi:hypothetical protein
LKIDLAARASLGPEIRDLLVEQVGGCEPRVSVRNQLRAAKDTLIRAAVSTPLLSASSLLR